jgi:defect-in-organelle-trafficking protein DotB
MSELHWPEEDQIRFTKEHFDQFIQWCFDQGASDIIIEAGEVLGAKIHGEVVDVGKKLLRYEEVSEILRTIYQSAAPALLKSGEELNFQYSVLRDDDSLIRFRVNATACQGAMGADEGVELVLRTIPGDVPKHDNLGIEQEIMDACSAKYGIILITGPTGSGKSTTIAAMLRMISETRRAHIITYESPIEFDLKSIPNRKARVIQSEVPANLKTYRVATANSLRRAPDIILFGEARDRETISACIRESQTGHLVFSTVHTNNVPMTISRMVDEFEPSERKGATSKLVDAMRMIVHQRLYPKLGGGRVAVREFLVFTDEMRRHLQMCLLSKDDLGSDIQELLEQHGKPLLSDAKVKFRDGCIDLAQYASIVNEVGSKKDLEIVPEVAKALFDNGAIDDQTYNAWISELEGAL